jgi:hypothetical protein
VHDELSKLGFNCHRGTLGSQIRVNNARHEEKLLRLNLDYPSNLHEFDILLLDLTKCNTEAFDPKKHSPNLTTGKKAHALLSQYPEQFFNPVPFSVNIISKQINELSSKPSIVVAFCTSETVVDYEFVEITPSGAHVTGQQSYSDLNFYGKTPSREHRSGKRVSLPPTDVKTSSLLSKYINSIEYGTVFYHPKVWDGSKNQNDSNFVPLLLNERGEIVSYAHFVKKTSIFVFPDVLEKSAFVAELFKTFLPEILPELFPFHGEFKWLESGEYPLPGEQDLIDQRIQIEDEYENRVRSNEEAVKALKEKFRFLTEIITATGKELVAAIEKYLKWLEFDSVVNLDDTNPDVLEEDLQIDYGDRFLVVEVKGIGGTSTDKDCAQISKIRYRRAEQRQRFDVFGLYIVNHQRYMPPRLRANPPFSANQIKDAELDKRGLITTYELYKAYFLIEAGVVSKASFRELLFKTGLISVSLDKFTSIGVPHEYFKAGEIAVLNLNNVSIRKGDVLIAKKHDTFSKVKIESLMLDDQSVEEADFGEVGIKFDKKIKRNSELLIEKK